MREQRSSPGKGYPRCKPKFGPEGGVQKPGEASVRSKVYGLIESYANERGYDFIFTKTSSLEGSFLPILNSTRPKTLSSARHVSAFPTFVPGSLAKGDDGEGRPLLNIEMTNQL